MESEVFYVRLEKADPDCDGNTHLILSKEKNPLTVTQEFRRFLGKDVALYLLHPIPKYNGEKKDG